MIRPFTPAPWLPGGLSQTVIGRQLRLRLRMPMRRERIETSDGDFVDLDWVDHRAAGYSLDQSDPLVLVLHGLEGSTTSGYVQHTFRALAEHGVRAVGMNFRACSGEMNRLPRFYHAGDTEDIATVVELLREREPETELGAIGFSLGGNALIKYLGERGDAVGELVSAAATVSVPFDLAAGADLLEVGLGRVAYSPYFVKKLLRKVDLKKDQLSGSYEIERAYQARTIREFDDLITAPIHGFRDADEYYRLSSSTHYLDAVRVPTLILQAEDDPFLPSAAIPRRAIAENPALLNGLIPNGGHVGFVTGTPWAPEFWSERELARFMHRMLAESGTFAKDAERISHS